METAVHLTKKLIRQPFDSVIDNLITELKKAGFLVSGIANFQEDFRIMLNVDYKNYKVISVHIPKIYFAALSNASINGIVLPCNFNVIEIYPEIVEVIPINSLELLRIGMKNDQYSKFVEEIDTSIGKVLNALEGGSGNYPDLITSWN